MDIVTKKPVSGDTTVTVHPLVLLSVVDHYNRACKGTKNRAVGVLLGSWKSPTSLDIANSFAGTLHSPRVSFSIVARPCTLSWLGYIPLDLHDV
jgi:hypothetical protein